MVVTAEEAYRAAVADMNGALMGHNIEAARAALRGLLGEIPVFQEGRHLAARLTINATSLLRNPDTVLLIGSGGVIPTNSPVIVPFGAVDRRPRRPRCDVPSHCGNGHVLTPENLKVSGGRWRCRRCGAERAARFRAAG